MKRSVKDKYQHHVANGYYLEVESICYESGEVDINSIKPVECTWTEFMLAISLLDISEIMDSAQQRCRHMYQLDEIN